MSSVVIVTEQCYLLAESINYIIINESEEPELAREYMLEHPKKKPKTKKKKTQSQKDKEIREYIQELKPFNVVISFEPKGGAPNGAMQKHSSGDHSAVRIQVLGLRRTLKVFKDIVSQLREQIPDERFLDTLVDRFLTSVENEETNIEKMELR